MTETKETVLRAKTIKYGKISKILCMIAAIYIAIVPESTWSSIFWIVYSIGAITGIVHLHRIGEKDMMQMYAIWLVLDVYAFIRLVFHFP